MFNNRAEFFFWNFSVANMAENRMQCKLQTMILCISSHFWSMARVWFESLFPTFQHKVEWVPHFARVTEMRQIYLPFIITHIRKILHTQKYTPICLMPIYTLRKCPSSLCGDNNSTQLPLLDYLWCVHSMCGVNWHWTTLTITLREGQN